MRNRRFEVGGESSIRLGKMGEWREEGELLFENCKFERRGESGEAMLSEAGKLGVLIRAEAE